MAYDVIVRNGLWFDGTGAAPAVRDLGISDGRVVEVSSTALSDAARVIDASGQWVVPGFVDIHTHYDVEICGIWLSTTSGFGCCGEFVMPRWPVGPS